MQQMRKIFIGLVVMVMLTVMYKFQIFHRVFRTNILIVPIPYAPSPIGSAYVHTLHNTSRQTVSTETRLRPNTTAVSSSTINNHSSPLISPTTHRSGHPVTSKLSSTLSRLSSTSSTTRSPAVTSTRTKSGVTTHKVTQSSGKVTGAQSTTSKPGKNVSSTSSITRSTTVTSTRTVPKVTSHKVTQSSGKVTGAQSTTAVPGKKVICVNFSGRLGNQLFQYAAVFGMSRKQDRIPVYGNSKILSSALQHSPPSATQEQKDRCKTAKREWEKNCCHFQKKFLELNSSLDYAVGQYLQSYKYFEGVEEELKTALRFKDNVQQKANKTLEELRKTCNKTLIGVHVRRGDYLIPRLVKYGYRTATPYYFHRAMDYMRNRFGNVTFLVSVDNGKWFMETVKNASDVVILKRQDPVTDMALLASLDHVITTVGTYSWWVGYLNHGVTTYFKDFIARGTPIGDNFNPNGTTYIYPGWIPF